MINRVLIRIKVVQLLYSYLLVENSFNIEAAPAQPTREKRFAYNLYMEMLALMVDIADNITQRGGIRPLYQTRFIQRVANDEKMRSLIQKHNLSGGPFAELESPLTTKVKESGLYKKFLKSEDMSAVEHERIWQDIFNIIIMPDSGVSRIISEMDGYTLSGVDRMREMMETTFSKFYGASENLSDALNTLKRSMDKARELYIRLLQLPILITNMREQEIEENRTKFLATAEDRNPTMRFVENALVAQLNGSEELDKAIERYGMRMSVDDEPMLRGLLNAILASDYYKEYMAFPATDYKMDCDLWKNLYKYVIFENPLFLETLEEKSVFWNDDLGIIGDFVLKTVKKISDYAPAGDDHLPVESCKFLLPMYKDSEDARFGAELFEYVVKNKDTYRGYIDEALEKSAWESERLAYMDVVVMMTALAEILNFPKIPLTVSINEYIEIAKAYSTAKSGQFVHGILSDILKKLKEEGKLLK